VQKKSPARCQQKKANSGELTGVEPKTGKKAKECTGPAEFGTHEPNAAGIDIGAREIYVAIPADRDETPVRRVPTFTGDLQKMAAWLKSKGIQTAAMESTGVDWIPVYDVLEEAGIRACLVNPRHMKNVPGKRTDYHECQWIQFLHERGLLRAAFRPDSDVRAVRTLMRERNDLVEMGSQHIQHLHKALTEMNIQIHHVLSDITGLTGLAILDAIVKGERDTAQLAKLRDAHVKVDQETVRKSLQGTWRQEHILALKLRLQLYRAHRAAISDCDQAIEERIAAFEPRADPQQKPLPEDRKQKQRNRKKKSGDPAFDLRLESYKLFGVDLTQVPGLMMLVLMLFSELGRDMSRWPAASHFVAWLGLCPDNDISGGKVLYRGRRKINNRAGTLFRLGASSLARSDEPLGHHLRRMKAKLGPPGATTATARKIAVIFYTMVKTQTEYDASRWAAQDQLRQQRLKTKIEKQAARLGFKLVATEETHAA